MFILLTKFSSGIVSAIQVEKELTIGSCLLNIRERSTHHKIPNKYAKYNNQSGEYLFIYF